MELDGQVLKSKTKWGTKDPTWNEEFILNVKLSSSALLQVAAWNANLVTPHKRMGNVGVDLETLCDGNSHELLLELEGMGGGGKIQLEVKYKSFGEIDEDKKWWKLPFVAKLLRNNGVESAIKMFAGSESISVRQFVEYSFGQLKSLNDSSIQNNWFPSIVKQVRAEEGLDETSVEADAPLSSSNISEGSLDKQSLSDENHDEGSPLNDSSNASRTNMDFWMSFGDVINEKVIQKLGIPVPDKMKWDAFDLINKIGFQSRKVAEVGYIESGLATPDKEGPRNEIESESSPINLGMIQSSLPDIRRATEDILKQTDSIFSALMVLSATSPQFKESLNAGYSENKDDSSLKQDDDVLSSLRSERLAGLEEKQAEEMKALFSTAESAMEAWAMLATALGQPSLIKSEFEKIYFLDNSTTDTQVAIWRDSTRKRLVVAFRGTEQWFTCNCFMLNCILECNEVSLFTDFSGKMEGFAD